MDEKNTKTPKPPKADAPKTKEPKTKEPKESKGFGVTLRDGANNALKISAKRTKKGVVLVQVKHVTKDAEGNKATKRGATQEVADLAAARPVVESIMSKAKQSGWVGKGIGRQRMPKADQFTIESLPAPIAKAADAAPATPVVPQK